MVKRKSKSEVMKQKGKKKRIIFSIFKDWIKLIQFSSNVISLIFKSGFGSVNVKGFNLSP